MRFGLLPITPHGVPETYYEPVLDQPTDIELPIEKPTVYTQANKYATELKEILETVNKEFNEMGSFAKRWGLRDFQKKTGLSIEGWLQTEMDVIAKLQDLIRSLDSGDLHTANILQAQLLSLKLILEKLADYFQCTQKDAKGFLLKIRVLCLRRLKPLHIGKE